MAPGARTRRQVSAVISQCWKTLMARLGPFVALASAVAEGRLSAQEFATICLPLYKNYPDPFPSREHFELATELFYLANDYADEPFDDLIGADQVREGCRPVGHPNALAAGCAKRSRGGRHRDLTP